MHRLLTFHISIDTGFPGGAVGEENIYQCRRHGDVGLIPGSGRSLIPWRRKWQFIPVSCLENPMDRGGWRATVHGVTKSQTRPITCAHAHVKTHTTDVFAFRPTILLFGSCFPYFVPDALFLPSFI